MTRFYMFRFVSVCFQLSQSHSVVYIVYSRSICVSLFSLILLVTVLSLSLSFPFRSMFSPFTVSGSPPILHFHGSSLLKMQILAGVKR